LEAGPNISVNLSDEIFIDNNIDFGLIGGIRFNTNKSIFFYGRYFYGISKLNEIYEVDKNFNQ
jgi:hypothetical protein